MQFMAMAGTFMNTYGGLVAAGASAVSSIAQGISTSRQMDAQAKAADYNAKVARQQAEVSAAAAGRQEEQQRRFARLQAGERRASMYQSGTGLDGSNLDVDNQSEIAAELDALNIRYEGNLQRNNFLGQAALQDYNAREYRSGAKRAMSMGVLGAATSMFAYGAGKYLSTGTQAAAPIYDRSINA